MISTLVGLLLILVGLSFLATGSHGDLALIQAEGLKAYGLYAGPALILAGFIIGKFWSLKYKPKRSSAGNE